MANYQYEKTYTEIIGITKDHRIIILDHIFKYDDGFKGATRYEMNCLTQQDIDNENDPETVKEYVREMWQMAVDEGRTELGLDDYAEKMTEEIADGNYYLWDDPSFRRETDQAYEKLTDEQKATFDKVLGKRGQDFVDWTCGTCGRIGEEYKKWDWEVLFRPDLLKEIAKYEG